MTPAFDKPARGTRALRRGRFSGLNHVYLVTSCTFARENFFADFSLGRIVVRSLKREDDAGHTKTLAFVVMPDHLHWLVQITGHRSLSASVNVMKSFAARNINRALGKTATIWQKGFHDRALRAEENLESAARYIVANPLRAGLVRRVEDYPLWDAIWL